FPDLCHADSFTDTASYCSALPGYATLSSSPCAKRVTTAMSQRKPATISSSEVNSRSQCETPSFEGINNITEGATLLIETESCPAIVCILRTGSPKSAAAFSASSTPSNG